MAQVSKFVSVMTYHDADSVKKLLEDNASMFQFAEFITHDADDAEVHTHVNLVFLTPKAFFSVRNLFNSISDANTTLVKETLNTQGAHDYLTHKNAPEKHRYDDDSVCVVVGRVSDYVKMQTDAEFRKLQKVQKKIEDNEGAIQLIEDIIAKTPTRVLISKYGRDYLRNRDSYHKIAQFVMMEEGASVEDIVSVGRSFEYMFNTLYEARTENAYDNAVFDEMIAEDKKSKKGE